MHIESGSAKAPHIEPQVTISKTKPTAANLLIPTRAPPSPWDGSWEAGAAPWPVMPNASAALTGAGGAPPVTCGVTPGATGAGAGLPGTKGAPGSGVGGPVGPAAAGEPK